MIVGSAGETPVLVLARRGGGTPCPSSGRGLGYPYPGTWLGYSLPSPGKDLGPRLGGTPCLGKDLGPLLPTWWTNWKHYLPVVLRMRAVTSGRCVIIGGSVATSHLTESAILIWVSSFLAGIMANLSNAFNLLFYCLLFCFLEVPGRIGTAAYKIANWCWQKWGKGVGTVTTVENWVLNYQVETSLVP